MTVSELIAHLTQWPGDAPVLIEHTRETDGGLEYVDPTSHEAMLRCTLSAGHRFYDEYVGQGDGRTVYCVVLR